MADTPLSPEPVKKGDDIIGEGEGFQRIRRITGYLVGTLDRFNNAKRAEERDRVKHGAADAAGDLADEE